MYSETGRLIVDEPEGPRNLCHRRCQDRGPHVACPKGRRCITRPRLPKPIQILWHRDEQRCLEAESYGLVVAEGVNNRRRKRLDALWPMKLLAVRTRNTSRPSEAVARDLPHVGAEDLKRIGPAHAN